MLKLKLYSNDNVIVFPNGQRGITLIFASTIVLRTVNMMLDSQDQSYDGIKAKMNKKHTKLLMLSVNENCSATSIIWKLFFHYIKKIPINTKIPSLNTSYV